MSSTVPFPVPEFYYLHDLQAHWRAGDGACYTILQTGFDAGRQLLKTWSAWQADHGNHDERESRLHYLIAAPLIEWQQPLAACSAAEDELLSQLQAAWPPATLGYHRLLLAQGGIEVTLIMGDLVTVLTQAEAQIDCFLLHDDPLWSASLFKLLARLAAPQAQLHLRSMVHHAPALQQAGFAPAATQASFSPHRGSAAVPVRAMPPPSRHAIVIGAGLAGSAACQRLSARGWQVSLLEQHGQAAQEASGNLAGVWMPVISRDDNPSARLSRAAFLYAQQLWRQLGILDPGRGIGQACGVLQLARDAAQAEAFEQAAQHWQYPAAYAQWMSSAAASALLGMPATSGWWFPGGGWLRPGAVCEALLQACGNQLQRRFHQRVAGLQRTGQEWQVLDQDGTVLAQAPVLILANGMQALRFEQAAALPLHAIRGQVSHVPVAQLPPLSMALCGDGYVTGAVDGLVSMGASYDQDDDTCVRLDSHQGNLAKLRQMLPHWQTPVDPATWQGRVGFRCVSADRLPLVGALPDLAMLAQAGEVQLKQVPRHTGLFGLLGYASRGLIWAPLAAEILACHLTGEPAPVGRDALALFDPARFALKAHRRLQKP
jgi:tRNA 5-methylaminomethyl-2-thiouridine biosynthesis bifunctional protein